MNKTDYAYSVAYIRAVENKLLTKADIENLIAAKSPDEALQLLLDKGYGREKISPYQFETLLKEQLMEVLDSLTPREKKVLRLRFGLDDGKARTLEEVGKEFNVTRERIRQIEAKALRKLRHPSRSKKLKDFLD